MSIFIVPTGLGVAVATGGSVFAAEQQAPAPAPSSIDFTAFSQPKTALPTQPAPLTNPTASTQQGYASSSLLQTQLAKEAQQRLTSIAPRLQELEAEAQKVTQMTLSLEQQWVAAQAAGGLEEADFFVKYINSRRTYADSAAQTGQSLLQAIQTTAGGDTALQPLVARARTANTSLQARAGRVAELERFALAWRTQLSTHTGSVVSGATGSKSFPWWGYAIGGVVVIGAAVYFGGK